MRARNSIDDLLDRAYRAVVENRWGDAQMLIANIQYQRSLAPSGEATPDPTWNAYVEAWMNGNYSGSADPMMSYEECRAKAENEANRYIAARLHQEKPI